MALAKGTRKEKRSQPTSFRFTGEALLALRTLSEYSGLSQVDVVENLLESEYERLKGDDKQGLEKARKAVKSQR
jgi:hypothetical protein